MSSRNTDCPVTQADRLTYPCDTYLKDYHQCSEMKYAPRSLCFQVFMKEYHRCLLMNNKK